MGPLVVVYVYVGKMVVMRDIHSVQLSMKMKQEILWKTLKNYSPKFEFMVGLHLMIAL